MLATKLALTALLISLGSAVADPAEGGPNRGPQDGPNGGPMGGPNRGPMGGPNGGPMGGPNGGPMGDPNRSPMGGPNGGPMGGPNGGPNGGSNGGSGSNYPPMVSYISNTNTDPQTKNIEFTLYAKPYNSSCLIKLAGVKSQQSARYIYRAGVNENYYYMFGVQFGLVYGDSQFLSNRETKPNIAYEVILKFVSGRVYTINDFLENRGPLYPVVNDRGPGR